MKYSILVLGASISISLFIRICCAVETNALYKDKSESGEIFSTVGDDNFGTNSDELFVRHGEDFYKTFLKRSMLNDTKHVYNQKIKSRISQIVDEWTQELESAKSEQNHSSQFEVVPEGDDIALSIQRKHGMAFFNRQVCGITDPPNLILPDCESEDCSREDVIADLPKGCVYDELLRTMKCMDTDMTAIPSIPPHLNLFVLEVQETKIEQVPLLAFKNVSIQNIRFFKNAINYIDPWAFHGVENVKSIIINYNQLAFLTYELYVGLNETEIIDLSYNSITLEIFKTCPIQSVVNIQLVLPRLRSLKLTGNPLIYIPKQMFAGLRNSTLKLLYLDYCYLRFIHPDAFTYVSRLEILKLTRNPGIMPSLGEFIQPLTLLETLYLDDNGLSLFPGEALSALPRLKSLDISSNSFFSIKYSDMSGLQNLEQLYMDDSQISFIEDGAFAANIKLHSLSLQNNKLSKIPAHFPLSLNTLFLTRRNDSMAQFDPQSFQNLTNLANIEMHGVRTTTISSDYFVNLPSLRKLYLVGCDIQHIEDGAFQDLPHLNLLSLKDNEISDLTSDTFKGLDNLITLNMPGCKLSFSSYVSSSPNGSTNGISTSPFINLPKLEKLDLSDNKITQLSDILFQNLTSLKDLDLSGNAIESWETRLFPDRVTTVFNLTSTDDVYIFKVDLADGNIQFLTDAMIEDFLRMTKIDLSSNTFVCDERACLLRDIINASINSNPQEWLNQEEYRCVDIESKNYHSIVNIEDDACKTKVAEPPQPPGDNIDGGGDQGLASENSSTLTTLITIAASVSVVAVVVIILAYKNRAHLRYFWFKTKFTVAPASPRKAKLSTMESTCEYDYDVFISYHNKDSKFIADVFLPEIEHKEMEGSVENICEAKSEIYLIENEGMSVINSSHKSNDRINISKQKKTFKVCLHERDFAAGVPITENIVDCVDRSEKMIIFVSKKYMESQWCSFEMNLVYHRLLESRRKAFALVLLEEIPSELRSKVLNYLMITKTYLQWPGMNGSDTYKASFWRRLRAFLQSTN